MKRVLVFLGLVAVGLGVVLWIERGGEPEPEVVPPAPPPPVPEDDAPPATGIAPGGTFELRAYAEGEADGAGAQPLRFEVRAQESSLGSGNVWELTDVEAELYDPEDHTLQVRLWAASGQAIGRGDGAEYRPEFEEHFFLRGVEAEVLSGAPVVPLVVRSPTADLRLDERTIASEDEVQIDGAGIAGRGTNWFVDLDSGALSFDGGGELELARGDGTRATFDAQDAMRLYDAPGELTSSRPPLLIEGVGGARIALGGEESPRLGAERILLRGDALPGSESGFGIRAAEMEGDVVWRSGQNEFRGERARASFDGEGVLRSAVLEERPYARLFVPADAELGEEALAQGAVRVGGEGPLELDWRDGLRFTMQGPATVEGEDTDLRSNGALSGWMDEAGQRAGFTAGGGVVLESAQGQLETAELEVTIDGVDSPTPEERTLRALSRGGARFLGTLADGAPFRLTSPDRLEVVREGGRWSVVDSTQISLTVEGASGFQASAARVRSFELGTQALEAEGDIRFESADGSGAGARLVMRGTEDVVLEGSDEELASFEGPGGRAEARFVEVKGERLHARGDVRANVESFASSGLASAPGERYEIVCDELVVQRGAATSGGEVQRTFVLDADGAVEARAFSERTTTTVRAEELGIRRAWTEGREGEASSLLVAEGAVRSSLESGDERLDLEARHLRVEGPDERASAIEAEGDVRFEGTYGLAFGGRGHRLVMDQDGTGSLTPLAGERVEAHGGSNRGGVPFSLTADEIQFTEGSMHAVEPEVELDARPRAGAQQEAEPADQVRAKARELDATREAIELTGDVRLEGTTRSGAGWTLRAARVRFEGDLPDDPAEASLRGLVATGGVSFLVGETARAEGEALEGRTLFGTMRLTGSPARITSPTSNLEAEWIEFDPELQIVVATGPGVILPNPSLGETRGGWSLEYISSRTLVEPDSFVFALQEPVLRHPETEGLLRASWAMLWIDRLGWPQLAGDGDSAPGTDELRFRPGDLGLGPLDDGPMGSLFGTIAASEISGLLREMYFEGPIELSSGEYLIGHSDAMYLDVVSGHGWIANATVNVWGHFLGQDFTKLVVKADWLRHSADGSMRADSATVTPCDHDKPHVRVVTGDLSIRPGDAQQFELALQDNRIELYGLIKIPLPPIKIGTDEEYSPLWQTLRLANSARFGTLVSAGLVRPAGRVGEVVNTALRGNPLDYDAKYRINASYLGLRGILLDLGFEVESKEKYWLDMYVGGLPDRGRDRGFVRVPEDERDTLRLWYRANGRYLIDEDQWVDLALTLQTDPGVQSEFFESEFLRYEQSENYLRWRKARDGRFYDASVEKRLEEARSQIEELPSAGAFVGRTPVAELGGVPLLYTGSGRAEYLRRRAGEFGRQSPFAEAPPIDATDEFADGFGDRDVLRLDTQHRFEAPISLGAAGLRATPFLGARATAWDEGQNRSQSPTRLRAEGGLRLSTTLWRRSASRALHQIVPFVQLRGQIAEDTQGGDPVPFDRVEVPVEGSFVELGARGRFGVSDEGSVFDVELRGAYAHDVAAGAEQGWMPTAVFARLDIEPWGRPLEIWHDGRYDFGEGDTIYSLVSIATRIGEDLRLEASHHRGLDAQRQGLFEAASIRGVYRWTEKWEFEGRETFSLLDDEELDTRVVIRRYGHDVVFELETAVRAGEGGTTFGISVQPRFGYRPPRIGYLNY